MQIPRISRLEESIFFIICGCLFASLAWRLLHVSSNVLSPRSILETRNSGFEGSGKDQANTRNVPWCSQAGGNQFLPSCPVENRCNCADFVPVHESQSGVEKPSVLNFKAPIQLLDNILKNILKTIQKLLLTIVINIYKNLQKYCDVSEQVNTIERLRNLLNEPSNYKIKMNRSKCNIVNKETPNKKSSITGKRSLTNKIPFQGRLTKSLSKDIDRSQEKFNKDETAEKNSPDVARSQREKYAANVYDRKNSDITWNDNDPCSHKFGSCSEIARYNADDNSASSDTKIKENSESVLIRSMAEMFLASILRDSDVFGAESKQIQKEYSTEEERKANTNVSFVDDEICSKMLADKMKEYLTFTVESDKICSRMEGDYPGKQSGMLLEKGMNLVEEESLMHSGKNATQFGVEEKERDKEVGSSPDPGSVKNCRKSESMGFSDSLTIADRDKEEEDLNAIVRRMIVIELKKHRKKEEIVLKRAHSDSGVLIQKNSYNATNRIGLCSLKGRTFFRDLLELEENLRGNNENKSIESIKVKVDEGTAKEGNSMNQGENNSKNDVNVPESTDCANLSEDTAKTICEMNSNVMVKRKINLPCLMNANFNEEKSAEPEKTSETHVGDQDSKSTQTERVYVIRAARSCPLRKRRVLVQQQLHRLTDREPYYSTTVFASRDRSRFMYRKASDDLIYEKGKGSRSPSYIPAPERFRWKYLIPNKVE